MESQDWLFFFQKIYLECNQTRNDHCEKTTGFRSKIALSQCSFVVSMVEST